MSGDLAGMDTEAVTEAVETLREAGFRIHHVENVERNGHGVEFDMSVEKTTRTNGFGEDA